jgi:adenosylcobinamide-phosphate synthase
MSTATTALLLLLALLLDWQLGEPRRWHPLVGFGRLVARIESRLHGHSRLRGVLAVTLLLLPVIALAACLARLPHGLGTAFSLWALYFSIGLKSLHDHTRPVIHALDAGDTCQARHLVARIVSRDEAQIDIIPATCETVLENGHDAVFGALFWFIVAGAPGAILFRLANTLDAMWGYRNARYLHFGWAAARLDDLLGWLPARLTALTYALQGRTALALYCWHRQAPTWKSPNAGPVMAAGAGALNLQLGGAACYGGIWQTRPTLGTGEPPVAADIERALALVRHGVWLWIVLAVAAAIFQELEFAHA